MENKSSKKNRTSKVLAIALVAMLSIHLYGLLFTVNLHSAFATTDTFSIENVTWINITVMTKDPGTWELVKLTVSESVELNSRAASSGATFAPNGSEDRVTIIDINERQEMPVGQITFAGQPFKVTSDTMFGVLSTFANGTSIAANTSDYYRNFTRIQQAYPVRERMILFDSPANYAQRFCDERGYVLNNVVNSTYIEYFDVNSLNLFSSHLVKTDYIVTEPINMSALKAATQTAEELAKFGGDLTTQVFPWIAMGIIALIALCTWIITPALVDMCRIRQTAQTAREQIAWDAEVTLEGIQAQREIDVALTGAKAANEQLILDMIANGTLTYDEGAALIAAIGADYSDLLTNRTTNIESILDNYYNHTSEMWGHYNQGLGVGTSWTDYLWPIIIFIIIGFSIYLIYVLINRKGPKGQPQSILIFK